MINHKSIILLEKELRSFWENNKYRVYWEGLIFIDGILSGEESVKEWIKEVQNTNMERACLSLKGTFFLIVQSKISGDIYAFVDNSGSYHAFHSNNAISNSFLQLVRHEGCPLSDMNPAAVAEFLHFGWLFSNKTYFDSINRIGRDDIYFISGKSDNLRLLKKSNIQLTDAANSPSKSFEEYFQVLNKSLSNCRISVDLTGGIDTRIVAAMLKHCGLAFETASSGGTEEYIDVAISGKIAKVLERPWFPTIHCIAALEQEMDDVFRVTDGLYDVLYYHRLYQLQKARRARGIDTMISGVGGEMFKDHWWLHEFPFYYRKDSNIAKFVDMRIMSFKPVQGIFTDVFTAAGNNLRKDLIAMFSMHILDRNTKTYDNIFYNFIMADVGGRILTSHSNLLKCYAPFLDLNLARMGFNLPRGERIYNLFHRRELTKINPELARLGTSENSISVSDRPVDMICDVPKFMQDKLKRLLIKYKLISRKDNATLNVSNYYNDVRDMQVVNHLIEVLKNAGIVDKKTQVREVGDNQLGSLLSLAMLVQYLNDNSNCHRPSDTYHLHSDNKHKSSSLMELHGKL